MTRVELTYIVFACTAIGLAVGNSGCREPKVVLREFPVERTLTDNHGRVLHAELLYQTPSVVHIVRLSDGFETDVELASLSHADRHFLSGFTTLSALPPPPDPSPIPPDSYISFRLERIETLKDELKSIEATPPIGSFSLTRLKKWRSDAKEKQQAIRELQEEIDLYKDLQRQRAKNSS